MASPRRVEISNMSQKSATAGSNYDKARTLANLKMEQAKSLSFTTVKDSFPVTGSTPNATSGYYQSAWLTESGPASADFTNFQYRVEKQFMKPPSQTPGSPAESFVLCSVPTSTCSAANGPIRVTVTVRWGNGNTYTIFG